MKELSNLKLRNKKYIIFDMDGTLIDSIGIWNFADQEIIKRYGGPEIDLDKLQFERALFFHKNQKDDVYLAYCDYLINKYNLNIDDKEEFLRIRRSIANEKLSNEIDFKPDSVKLILKLKNLGFTVALATVTTQRQIDIYSTKNKKMLKQMNIKEVFDLIITQDDVRYKKPHPEIYNKVIKHYNATPDECLVFEDSYTGVLASSNAGIEVVNVYDKYSDSDRDKIDEIADYSIKNYKEFIDFVDEIF